MSNRYSPYPDSHYFPEPGTQNIITPCSFELKLNIDFINSNNEIIKNFMHHDLMLFMSDILPKDIASIIIEYDFEIKHHKFYKNNIHCYLWEHIDFAICVENNSICTKSFDEINELYKQDISRASIGYYSDFEGCVMAHTEFMRLMALWGKKINTS